MYRRVVYYTLSLHINMCLELHLVRMETLGQCKLRFQVLLQEGHLLDGGY